MLVFFRLRVGAVGGVFRFLSLLVGVFWYFFQLFRMNYAGFFHSISVCKGGQSGGGPGGAGGERVLEPAGGWVASLGCLITWPFSSPALLRGGCPRFSVLFLYLFPESVLLLSSFCVSRG